MNKNKIEQIKIYNMDCMKGLEKIPNKSIDLVIIDSPYQIETSGCGIYKYKKYNKDIKTFSNGFDMQILDKICLKMKKINIYIWCSQKQIFPLLNYFIPKECNYNIITLHKRNPIPACNNKYLTDTEYCLFFREKGVKIYGDFYSKFTYYMTSTNQNTKLKNKYKHPTVKPIEIIQNFIINSSKPGDTVLDCFLGSGTTAVSCINTTRNFIGFEIDEKYFNLASRRIIEESMHNKDQK